MKNSTDCTIHQMFKNNEIAATNVVRAWEKNEDYILSWLEGRMGGDHWEDRDVVRRTILEEIF